MTDLVPVERLPLADVSARVVALIRPDSPADQVADVYQQIEQVKRILARVLEVRTECLLEWLAENGNELVMGDTKLYAGKRTDEKVRNLRAAAEAALKGCGGDWDQFVSLLSSGALKPGEVGKVLGEQFRAEHFEKRYSPTVEVKQLNTRFLKGKATP